MCSTSPCTTSAWKEGPLARGQSVLYPERPDADALMARLRDFTIPVPDPSDATPEGTRVRVLNASAKARVAGSALAGLEKVGFKAAGAGNADNPLQASEVHYAPGKQDEAALVAGFVTGPVEVVPDDSVTGADVTLYIGRGFGGIVTELAPGVPALSLAPVPGAC